MKKRNKSTFGGILIFFVIIYILPAIIDYCSFLFRFPEIMSFKLKTLRFWFLSNFTSPVFLMILITVVAVLVLWACQKLEHTRLERETDFIQAEHLCKMGDENMQGYADAAEKRAQKQKRLSIETYGKRAPQSKYYNIK